MIVVILLLDIIIPGIIPKWAIFAPIFIPTFVQLGVPPQTVLAAYRVADSPLNTITPLMVYLPFMVTIAQRYQPEAGIGTIIALMLPYAVIVSVVWILLFVLWFVLGIPLGPGYPVAALGGARAAPTHERHRDRLRDPGGGRRPVRLRPGAGRARGDRGRARAVGDGAAAARRRRWRGSATRRSCSSRACSWSARAWTRPASRPGPGRSSWPGRGSGRARLVLLTMLLVAALTAVISRQRRGGGPAAGGRRDRGPDRPGAVAAAACRWCSAPTRGRCSP